MSSLGMQSGVKRNKSAFRRNWHEIIEPQIEKFATVNGITCQRNQARKRAWTAYKAFNKHCSVNYMEDPDRLLDRHKVASCYAYAVIAAQPLDIDLSAVKADSLDAMANERLAVTVACSILASYAKKAIEDLRFSDDDEQNAVARNAALNQLEKGVQFPVEVGHGSYLSNMYDALFYTREESSYDVLLLSMLMFHWESTMMSDDTHRRLMSYYDKQVCE